MKALYRRALAREQLGRLEEAELDANLALKATISGWFSSDFCWKIVDLRYAVVDALATPNVTTEEDLISQILFTNFC